MKKLPLVKILSSLSIILPSVTLADDCNINEIPKFEATKMELLDLSGGLDSEQIDIGKLPFGKNHIQVYLQKVSDYGEKAKVKKIKSEITAKLAKLYKSHPELEKNINHFVLFYAIDENGEISTNEFGFMPDGYEYGWSSEVDSYGAYDGSYWVNRNGEFTQSSRRPIPINREHFSGETEMSILSYLFPKEHKFTKLVSSTKKCSFEVNQPKYYKQGDFNVVDFSSNGIHHSIRYKFSQFYAPDNSSNTDKAIIYEHDRQTKLSNKFNKRLEERKLLGKLFEKVNM